MIDCPGYDRLGNANTSYLGLGPSFVATLLAILVAILVAILDNRSDIRSPSLDVSKLT